MTGSTQWSTTNGPMAADQVAAKIDVGAWFATLTNG